MDEGEHGIDILGLCTDFLANEPDVTALDRENIRKQCQHVLEGDPEHGIARQLLGYVTDETRIPRPTSHLSEETLRQPIRSYWACYANKIPQPYSAPVARAFPAPRADVPDLLGEGMISNPGFSDAGVETTDDVSKLIAQAKETLFPGDIRRAYERCSNCIPEFYTQFSDQKMQEILAGNPTALAQMAYAFHRLVGALTTEERLECYNLYLHSYIGESILRLIPSERVRRRIREAMNTWDAMLGTPHRNICLNLPMDSVDEPTRVSQAITIGKKLAQRGPEYFQCSFGVNAQAGQGYGGWEKSNRRLHIFGEQSPYSVALTLIHELIHVCQSNDMLRRSYGEWEQFVDRSRRITKKYPNARHITNEAEAYWIEANILDVHLRQSGQDLDSFCKREGVNPSHIKYFFDLYEKHRRGVTSESIYPAAFMNDLALAYKKDGHMFLEEVQTGEFREFQPKKLDEELTNWVRSRLD